MQTHASRSGSTRPSLLSRALPRGSKRRKAMLFVVAPLLVPAAAFAIWAILATGPGAGKIGELSAPTVAVGSPTGAVLMPGGTGAAVFSVTNPASNGPLVLTGVADDPSSTTQLPFGTTGCTPGKVTVNARAGLSIPVPTGTTRIEVPDAYALASDAEGGCQGLSFTRSARLTFSTP